VNNKPLIYFYVVLSGWHFDPDAYARSQASPVGEVRTRRHSGPPLDDGPPVYWRSENVPVARNNLSETLEHFLSELQKSHPGALGAEVTVQIIDASRTHEDRGGYFFSSKLLQLLAEIGAKMDIDVEVGELL
jgi:hypothetical protein